MDFNGSQKIIGDLFDPEIDPSTGYANQKSYIYIISKVIDKKRFYKVGEGKRSISRLKSANTFLIPGLNNKYFQLHNLFFYDESPYPMEFSESIERELHKILRSEFPQYNIKFANEKETEWYLPRSAKEFLEFVIGLIAVNFPKPREAYEFAKDSRKSILKSLNTKKYQKYAKDHNQALNKIKITKVQNKKDAEKTKGNLVFWRDKLLNLVFTDDRRNFKVTDVEYDRGLQRYIVGYAPTKPKNDIEKAGFETQLVEFLRMLSARQINKLDIQSNIDYWESQLTGGGHQEHSAVAIYELLTDIVCAALGKCSTTAESELNKLGRQLFKKKFKGVFAGDDNLPKEGMYIFNTASRASGGEHWLAHAGGLVYDSFGRRKYGDLTGDAEQEDAETNCGQRCLAWLMAYHLLGKDQAKLI